MFDHERVLERRSKSSAGPASIERRRPGEATPLYRMRYDPAEKLIRFEARGFWTIEEAADYIRDGYLFVTDCRAYLGEVNILVDRRYAPVQAAEIAANLEAATSAILPKDRVAIIVGSSLAMLQLRRSISHPFTKAFLSEDAARAWLTSNR